MYGLNGIAIIRSGFSDFHQDAHVPLSLTSLSLSLSLSLWYSLIGMEEKWSANLDQSEHPNMHTGIASLLATGQALNRWW